MTIRNVREFVQSSNNGEGHTSFFHKTTLPTPTAGWMIDLSMGAGTPKYNAYVGSQATATALVGSGNDGIYLGANPPPDKTRYINRVIIQPIGASLVPAVFYLMDYLLFYPLIDGDDTDIQLMDNTVTLPRNVGGDGVRIMLVCTTPMTAAASFTITYTNSDGISGRTATGFVNGVGAQTGYVVHRNTNTVTSGVTPFVALQGGDKGVRSIESVQLGGAAGGFFCAVLVKPKVTTQTQDLNTSSELYTLQQRGASVPSVENGAYLNWIAGVNGAAAMTPFRGEIDFIWN